MTDASQETEKKQPSRRDILRYGCVATLLGTTGAAGILSQTTFFDRLLGVTHTPLLEDATAWNHANNTVTLALDHIPELTQPGTAVRLEDHQLPENLLIVHGTDEQYYVFVNKCTHGQRKIDLDENGQLKCASMGQSTFDYKGTVLSGSAESPLTSYTVEQSGGQLIITLS